MDAEDQESDQALMAACTNESPRQGNSLAANAGRSYLAGDHRDGKLIYDVDTEQEASDLLEDRGR